MKLSAENKKVLPFFFSKSNTVSAILFLVSAFFYFIKWSLYFKGDDVSFIASWDSKPYYLDCQLSNFRHMEQKEENFDPKNLQNKRMFNIFLQNWIKQGGSSCLGC